MLGFAAAGLVGPDAIANAPGGANAAAPLLAFKLVATVIGITAMHLNTAFLVLIFFSPTVSGSASSMFPNVDFAWFSLSSPGIISIPLAFLAAIVVTLMTKPDDNEALAAEMEVRSLTGVGVEAPVAH